VQERLLAGLTGGETKTMELSGPEAAEVLNIEQSLFRKRLQQAREAILQFTRSHCGLVSDAAACRCHQRVPSAAIASFAEGQPLTFARRATSFQEARALVRLVEEARSALALHHTSEARASTIDFAQRLVSGMSRPIDSPSERDR